MAGRIAFKGHPVDEIVIRPHLRFVVGPVAAAFLVLWFVTGIEIALPMPGLVSSSERSVADMIFAFLLFCVGTIFSGLMALWFLIGRTLITLSTDDLVLASRIGTIAKFQQASFSIDKISRLRVEPRVRVGRHGSTRTVYVLAFDYGDRAAELKVDLDRAEADALANGPLNRWIGT